ncbi:m7GpppN-mRNA hydrolase [[Candida] jaroonii]|uniref:M7GpppN-mRNA hydrolase n=1 Tax=[Candida] jaroonii TaxID=467808 RepID=A0ACA9Y872_9ASCO|nr:m7GpppN-mRNA hydrolase [[Candida] jaroonii]
MSLQLRDGLANKSLDHILEDLLVRFVVNVPNEDLSSVERVLFQVEEAQWFYTDFLKQQYPGLPGLKMKSFSAKMLEKCPLIWKWGNPSEAVSIFGKYKSSIPVRGIALFNSDVSKILLVKGYESNHWSFPRGKISKDEEDLDCAVREVEEETGFNARDLINEDDYIERTIHGKNYKIYLVKGVPEDFNFVPHVRNEIEKLEWFDVKSLQKKVKFNQNNFFIIPAVIKPMMKWIQQTKGLNEIELMKEAEVRLKNLLGVGKVIEPITTQTVDNDAGRELLDILQGISTTEDDKDVETEEEEVEKEIKTVSIPQSMAAPYAHLMSNNLPQQLEMNPMFNIQPRQPPATFPLQSSHPAQPSNLPQPGQMITPHPNSFEKPGTLINSKELLSVLTSKSKHSKELSLEDEARKKEDSLRNKAKANELMKLFKRTDSSATDLSTDTETEKTDGEELKPGKVTLLKKSDNPLLDMLRKSTPERTPSPAANDLLGLLRRPSPRESPKPPKETPIESPKVDSRNELLGMLHRDKPKAANELMDLLKSPKESKASGGSSASKDLLGLLKPKVPEDKAPEVKVPEATVPEAITEPKAPEGVTVPEPSQTPEPTKPIGADLLGLLHRNPSESTPKVTQPIAEPAPAPAPAAETDEFEDFEDFEDFDALNDEIHATTHDFYTPEPEPQPEQVTPQTNYEYNTNPYPTTSSYDSIPYHNGTYPQQYTPEPSKGNVRILKPGESLKDGHGNDLLSLLQPRNKTATPQPLQSPSDSLNAIYGSPHQPTLNSPPVPQAPRNSNASAALLGLLNKPKETPQSSPSNAANDLLSLLKRPSNS